MKINKEYYPGGSLKSVEINLGQRDIGKVLLVGLALYWLPWIAILYLIPALVIGRGIYYTGPFKQNKDLIDYLFIAMLSLIWPIFSFFLIIDEDLRRETFWFIPNKYYLRSPIGVRKINDESPNKDAENSFDCPY